MLILKHGGVKYGYFDGKLWIEWWKDSLIQFFVDRYSLIADSYVITYRNSEFSVRGFIKRDGEFHGMTPITIASVNMFVEDHKKIYICGDETMEIECMRCGECCLDEGK